MSAPDKPACRIPDIPIRPHPNITDAWDVWCRCGWGAVCDSPEAAAIGIAWHLQGGSTASADYPRPREWTRTADDTHVDYPALREHAEWLSQADMTDSQDEFDRHWDAFYEVVTPDLILDLIAGEEDLE